VEPSCRNVFGLLYHQRRWLKASLFKASTTMCYSLETPDVLRPRSRRTFSLKFVSLTAELRCLHDSSASIPQSTFKNDTQHLVTHVAVWPRCSIGKHAFSVRPMYAVYDVDSLLVWCLHTGQPGILLILATDCPGKAVYICLVIKYFVQFSSVALSIKLKLVVS
jgi:hypothetical protein